MLSKPLAFILQLVALVMLLIGGTSDPLRADLLIGGVILLLWSGWSIRERIKKGS